MEHAENREALRLWKTYDLQVVYAGFARMGPEWKADNVCSPFSRLYYIIQGEGSVQCAGAENDRLQEGHIYLIPAGLQFGYHCENYMEQLYFHLKVSGPDGTDYFRGEKKLWEKKAKERQLSHILKLYGSAEAASAFQLKGLLWEELAEFIGMGAGRGNGEQFYSPLVKQLLTAASNPVSASNRVRGLAARLHVSESTLSRRFRMETGLLLRDYLDQLVVEEACRMLIAEQDSIAGIAERLGFTDQFYFTKYFKRQMSLTPTAYRRQMCAPI